MTTVGGFIGGDLLLTRHGPLRNGVPYRKDSQMVRIIPAVVGRRCSYGQRREDEHCPDAGDGRGWAAVENGEYVSSSAVVREALRDW